MVVESYSGFAQRYNMIIGVLICALLTSILFLIMPFFGLFIVADVFLVVGCCIGLYFTFKNRKELQSHIEMGIVVGFVGSFFSLLLITFFNWIFYSTVLGFNIISLFIDILIVFANYGIIYIIVGIILGYLFGNRYRKREAVKTDYPLF